MKTSVAVLAAAAGLAMAKPKFLNTNFDVVPGEDFTLKFSGCDSGCTIELLNGPSDNLKPVRELGSDVKGSEYTFSLSDKFNTDVYAFRITDASGEENYSEQFEFEGATAPATPITTAEETTSAAETSSAEETSTVAETTTAEETTTMTTVSSDVETTSTPEASTTETESETTTGSSSEETTTSSDSDNQDDAAVRLGSSHVTLVVAAVALLGYFL
jgi:hypothetical protein